MQNKLPLINSAHGSETRNIINELIRLFNGMGYTYDEALQKAHDVLSEAQKTNNMNKDVQNQLNDLIIESGNANAEVSQARGGYPILNERLNAHQETLKKQTNLSNNQVSILDYENLVFDEDWSDAFMAAHDDLPADGGVISVTKVVRIKKPVIFTKRIYLKGLGFSHSTNLNTASTIIKDGNFTGLTFLGWNSFLENIDITGVTGNGGDGIQIVGSRIGMRQVSSRNHDGHGIRLGRFKEDNVNGWSMYTIFTAGNGGDGVHLQHGGPDEAELPDLSAGILSGLDSRANSGDGLYVGNTLNNTFLGVMSQHNGKHGVHVGANATGNFFINSYTELNEAGHTEEFYLAPNSRQNFVLGERSRIAYNSIKDEGRGNFILGTNSQLPVASYFLFSGLYTNSLTLENRDNISGRWEFKNTTQRNLNLDITGTSETGRLFLGNEERGLPLSVGEITIGENSKALRGLGVGVGTIRVGTVQPHSTTEITLPLADATTSSTVIFTPRADIPTGLMWSAYVKTNGIAVLRFANVTASVINATEYPFKATVFSTQT